MRAQQQTFREKENFPVASFVIPQHYRGDIVALYDFARGADEIVDAPGIPKETRYEQIDQLAEALRTPMDKASVPCWAHGLIALTREGKCDAKHGLDLLHAFRQDIETSRYENYAALYEYCLYSAAPVGRAVLQLAGETEANREAADALCIVLQLLNHMQDIRSDALERDRIYLPREWLEGAGLSSDYQETLSRTQPHPAVTQVKHRLLERCERLLDIAKPLPGSIQSYRLRLELRWIDQIARALLRKLRAQDPMTLHVALSPLAYVTCGVKALFPIAFHRGPHVCATPA